MLVTLTHLMLIATAERAPGQDTSECRGELAQAVPKDADPDLELFVCLGCWRYIVTKRLKGEHWKIINEYQGKVPRDVGAGKLIARTESPTCTDMPSPSSTPASTAVLDRDEAAQPA